MAETKSIKQLVSERLAESYPVLEARIVDVLAEDVLTKRQDHFLKALTALDQAEGELKKLGPDNKQFDGNGAVVSETYSQDQLNKKRKVVERIEKINNAINKAAQGDYTKLVEVAQMAKGDSTKAE